MRKLYIFLILIGILLSSKCTRIAENNDPVIGIWSNITTGSDSKTQKQTVKEEWIFNDAYLGRYHSYSNRELTIISDFKWTHKDNAYTISYPGLDRKEDVVSISSSDSITVLSYTKGSIFAIRE
ncbi:hypothetical protein KCTC52924_00363 [Arenibacter antarcticus]|uniref:Lipocalin-like domain-containing protein n=1 Tax=Arenibacter antarcticus TaxID=2040469 RepID=A0ABW5VC58_9FLAO|nr:hypothetical protein [Arenibacter sp. H213]MCM4169582.1 hypothetical protein [Arenibacter sp. H213]